MYFFTLMNLVHGDPRAHRIADGTHQPIDHIYVLEPLVLLNIAGVILAGKLPI